MRRIAAFVLLAILSASCSIPAPARDRNHYPQQSRAARKAAGKQQKASNKYSKQQQKAMKKSAKAQRKALKRAQKKSMR